jgi:hypothetical protein
VTRRFQDKSSSVRVCSVDWNAAAETRRVSGVMPDTLLAGTDDVAKLDFIDRHG